MAQTLFSIELSMEHLQYELMRLDMLLHRALWRSQQARSRSDDTPLENFYLSTEKAYALLKRPFGSGSEIDPRDSATYEQALRDITTRSEALFDQAARSGSRLAYLTEQFRLDRFALDIFMIALAPAIDTRYEALYGYLHDDLSKKYPSVDLILNLLCQPGPSRLEKFSAFGDETPLFKEKLLRRTTEWGPTLLSQPLHPDPGVVSWLLGHYQPHPELAPFLTLVASPQPDPILLRDTQRQEIDRLSQTDAITAFYGKDHLCQLAAAQLLAQQVDRPLLQLDLAGAQTAGFGPADILQLTLRDARLLRAIPFVLGWDTLLVEDAPPADLLAQLCQHPGFVLLAGEKRWQPRLVERQRQIFAIDFDIPAYDQRHQLLTQLLDTVEYQNIEIDPALDVAGLAGQFFALKRTAARCGQYRS